jgi:SAM-dependent methyltransferase
MRGPLLSGALGSATSLEALLRWAKKDQPAVVLGPLWLGEALAEALPILLLVATDDRSAVKRARRRAQRAGRTLEIAIGGGELPLAPSSVATIVAENVAGLDAAAAASWIASLSACLRPGGRLVAADATGSASAMARVSGTFLAAALVGITQELPRDGALLTVGEAPDARVQAARFAR